MRVLLIAANTELINMPVIPMGVGAVAAAAIKVGHEVRMLDLMGSYDGETILREALKTFRPDVIGVSVRNIDDQNMEAPRFLLEPVRGLIRCCRSYSRAPIVLGGAGYSIFPESALCYLGADMGIQGEGEEAFPALLERLEKGSDLSGTPGLYLPGKGVQGTRRYVKDLDLISVPDSSLWSESGGDKKDLWVPFQSRRGCPMDCSYCSTSTIEGRVIRRRTPARVADCIAAYAEKGFGRFFFVDNTFNLPPSYAKELCGAITAKGLDITWRCILYMRGVDRELVRAMARSGCREVSMGFESGCRRILRSMKKRFKPEDARRVSGLLADHGIRRTGFLLLGGPGETTESVEESLRFVDSLNLEVVKVTIGIRIYPYTALADTARDEGLISSADDLLFPKFYLAEGLENWLRKTVGEWRADRPHWIS